MEYPSGHHTHGRRHTQRDDDDREDYSPPRSGFNQPPPNYPPPQRSGFDNYPPPQRPGFDDYPPPPRHGFDDYPPPRSDFDQPDYPPRRPGYDQPPPPYHGDENQYGAQPPSRPTTQIYHTSHVPPPSSHTSNSYGFSSSDYPPPPQNYEDTRPPAYSATTVQHVNHDPDPDQSSETHHSYRPHLPSFLHHHTHESSSAGTDLSNKPTYKVYCKADPNSHLTIRDDKVVLAPSDPNDPYQNWYKDEKYSTRVKDKDGFPCFALVNKTTGQAVKHSVAACHPVQLVPYNADVLDQSVLWTEGKDLGDGYRAVRMVNNIKLNVDAFIVDKKSGGALDGTTVGVWEWNKGDNQRWRITLH